MSVTELRQLLIALCLDPKTKEFANQHIDMVFKMKSINGEEFEAYDRESITEHDTEPSCQSAFDNRGMDYWDSPPPDDNDSDADGNPRSEDNINSEDKDSPYSEDENEWGGHNSDAWGDEGKGGDEWGCE